MSPAILYMHNAEITTTMANLVQVVSMCNAWSLAGYKTTLLLRSRSMKADIAKQYLESQLGLNRDVSLELIRSSLPGKISRHISPLSINRIISKVNPDLCFVRDPVYFDIAIRLRKPSILELHNTRLHLGKEWINRIYKQMVLKGSKSTCCLAVITISDALAGFWEECGIAPKKIKSLHDGFSPEIFRQIVPVAEARKQFSLPDNRKIVVYTGNLQENRGISYILDIALLNPELLFVIAGGTPARIDHYLSLCKSRNIDNIVFSGHLPHPKIPALLYSSDVLLAMWSRDVPTIGYCSPLKVFEYMATGIPAVFPAYPTIKEVVEDGFNGFLADPDNLKSMNETLHRALSLSDKQLADYAKNARDAAFEKYTWPARIKEIANLLPENLRVS